MRILWTANLVPADVSERLGIPGEVLGGWVESMAAELRKYSDIELAVGCKTEGERHFCEEQDGVRYYSLCYPQKKTYEGLSRRCRELLDDFKPDAVHLEGTEFIHAKAMLFAARDRGIPVVASLQGVLNGQYAYQCGQLPIDDMMLSRSLTNMTAAWLLHIRKTRWYAKRLPGEREIIENADHILGRTTWDRAHSYALNPNAKYHYCGRILRRPFYEASWDINKMQRHSIYVGNSYYALKGFHFLVEALPLLLREFPDTMVYVAGYEPYKAEDKRAFFKKGYGSYLKKLIEDKNVGDHIVFMGALKPEAVAEKLSQVNCYALCSAVENSPNTLGEAMMVGTPSVAAYVGGVPDMATDGEEALFFRNDDPKLLAWNIKRVFDSDELAVSLSEKAKKRARITHDPARNAALLREAYIDILSK